MSISLNSSDLARTPSFEINDPERISSYMSSTFRPNRSIVRRKSNRVDFRHNSLQFGATSINLVRYGIEATVDAPPTQDIFLAMFTLAGSARVNQEKSQYSTGPGSFCILNPSQHLKVDLSKDFEQLTLRISGDTLRRSLLQLTHRDLKQALEFTPAAYPVNGQAASFSRLVKAICDDMGDQTPGFSHPAVCKQFDQALVNLLLTTFPHNYSGLMINTGDIPTPHFLVRAEDYINAHINEPTSVTELAVITGTSVRSLQNAFRRYRNTTPTAYLREKRLEGSRQALFTAAEQGLSVTDIAFTFGFSHLSKFAQYYKARFGESPSETRLGRRL